MSLNIRLQGLRQMIGISSALLTTSDCLSSYLLSVCLVFRVPSNHPASYPQFKSIINREREPKSRRAEGILAVIPLVKDSPFYSFRSRSLGEIPGKRWKEHFHSQNMFQEIRKKLFLLFFFCAAHIYCSSSVNEQVESH